LAALDKTAVGCCRSSGAHWLPQINWLSLVALDKADCHWLLPISWLFIGATDQLAAFDQQLDLVSFPSISCYS
jgi:hypothetical protein